MWFPQVQLGHCLPFPLISRKRAAAWATVFWSSGFCSKASSVSVSASDGGGGNFSSPLPQPALCLFGAAEFSL